MQNTSLQSIQSETRSEDCHADREGQQTNAILGVLALPIMEAPGSPQDASLALLAQPVLGEQPEQHESSPHHPISQHQRMSLPSLSPLQQPLPPHRLSLQQHSTLGYDQSVATLPQSPPAGHYSAEPSCSFTLTMSTPHKKPTDDNSSSSDSSDTHLNLRELLRAKHDVQPDNDPSTWGEDEPGFTPPKVNSQLKVKNYRCKYCKFISHTKEEFWQHSRGHIRPERLLTCPQCPFVTEYNHHLEYHLQNHEGSKPFKCDRPRCPYTCNTKAMLNSHLKSHSNIYEYRCLDCGYAAKYYQSLRVHMRKHNHNTAAFLNPDGSVDNLTIEDILSRKRGPKRPKKADEAPSSELRAVPILHPISSSPHGFMPRQTIPYPYNPLINPFSRSPLISFPRNPIMLSEHTPPKTEPENSFYNTTIINVQQSNINKNQDGLKECLTRVISTQQDIIARTSTADVGLQITEISHEAPLDLSRPELESQEQAADTVGSQQQSSDEDDTEPNPKQLMLIKSTEHSKANEEDEPGLALSLPDSDDNDPSSPKADLSEEERVSEERKERWRKMKDVYDCPFCDILFGNVVMYTMHMGYHSYQNPFTCNMCGHQTADPVQFTLHLVRQAHNFLLLSV